MCDPWAPRINVHGLPMREPWIRCMYIHSNERPTHDPWATHARRMADP